MLKSLMEGKIFHLRPEAYFIADMVKYWRQLKRNKMTDPYLNAEFTTTTTTIEYSSDQFKIKSVKILFGDHGSFIESLIRENNYRETCCFQVNQIIAAFLECCTRRYMEGQFGAGARVDRYIKFVKRKLLNPRQTILEEMSDDNLAEAERNMQYIARKQIKESLEALDNKFLKRYIKTIHMEQDRRREITLAIPSVFEISEL